MLILGTQCTFALPRRKICTGWTVRLGLSALAFPLLLRLHTYNLGHLYAALQYAAASHLGIHDFN